MKWGVRKDRSSRTGVRVQKRVPATEDAKKAKAHKTTAKRSGTDALTNKEMRDMLERMDLENRYVKHLKNNKKDRKKLSDGEKQALLFVANVGAAAFTSYMMSRRRGGPAPTWSRVGPRELPRVVRPINK